MRVPHIRLAALALLSSVTLGGCAYGLGDPYGGGYGGVNVGYGNGYYGSGYGYPYGGYGSYAGYGGYPGGYGYGGYGGYGYDPFGWYGDYYYPGSGIYVYDRDRHRHIMTDEQRQHWRELFSRLHSNTAGTAAATTQSVAPRENWSGFNRQRVRNSTTSSTSDGSRHWQNRQSVTTTTSDSNTTTRTPSDNGWRGRGHNRSNEQ